METAVVDPSHRQLGMATDDANPNFVGATDPDAALFVQFYTKPVQNMFRTKEEARPIFEDRLHIRIEIPGNRNSIIDTFATEVHKHRFAKQWMFYKSKHEGEVKEIGTPLSQWSLLTPARVEELRFMGFRSVEQVAAASDGNISKIGMAAGMDPFAFRERAKVYLQAAQGEASVNKQADENKKLRDEIEAQKQAQAQAAEKHAQEMAELRALIAQATQPKKRGRPPKVKTDG